VLKQIVINLGDEDKSSAVRANTTSSTVLESIRILEVTTELAARRKADIRSGAMFQTSQVFAQTQHVLHRCLCQQRMHGHALPPGAPYTAECRTPEQTVWSTPWEWIVDNQYVQAPIEKCSYSV
jgi:hypothetical protein